MLLVFVYLGNWCREQKPSEWYRPCKFSRMYLFLCFSYWNWVERPCFAAIGRRLAKLRKIIEYSYLRNKQATSSKNYTVSSELYIVYLYDNINSRKLPTKTRCDWFHGLLLLFVFFPPFKVQQPESITHDSIKRRITGMSAYIITYRSVYRQNRV